MSAAFEHIREKARRLRIHSLRATTAAGSGHPTSCLSAADLVAALFFQVMRIDLQNPHSAASDRFVLSKGHAAPLLYAALAEAGFFPVSRLTTLRQLTSELEGHPTPRVRAVDAATGSLGQGLSVGAGLAYGAKKLEATGARTYVLLGDGELAEGNVWEAVAFAAHYGLDNLTAIVDVNALGQSERTMHRHDTEPYRRRFEACGWHAEVVDGHDVPGIVAALERAKSVSGRPQAVIARTQKGHGVSFLVDKDGWHGKAVPREDLPKALAELLGAHVASQEELARLVGEYVQLDVDDDGQHSYERGPLPAPPGFPPCAAPNYRLSQSVATREAFGQALVKLAAVNPHVVVLDGDVKNSTFTEFFGSACPDRFIQGYIAEQNLIGVAVGLAARGHVPFVASFACFLERACDQIRMAGVSRSSLKLCGSHCGVSIGEDGPSQMGLEDLGLFRAIPGSTVLYPCDAVAAERLTEISARLPGITYLRTTRSKTPVLYANKETFPVPGFKVLRRSANDRGAVIAAGITVHEALKAYETLKAKGFSVRLIDLYCVKPIDGQALAQEIRAAGGQTVTVEDHYPEGGLGEAVLSALHDAGGVPGGIRRLAINGLPRSGKPEELLDAFSISARHIVAAVEQL